MTYVKRIVVLANSYKPPNGRCIAGKEVIGDGYGGWIRPVSARPMAEVSFPEYRYENNSSPKLLDIVDIALSNPDPRHHQTENHIIDATERWVKRGELPWEQLEQIRDLPDALWINHDHTNMGHYDCVAHTEAASLHDSLVLIRPDDFNIEVGRHYWTGRRTYRGRFNYKGT